jgi:hypothetical protein
MNLESWRPDQARAIKLHERCARGEDGGVVTLEVAFCPRVREAILVDECHDCTHFWGTSEERGGCFLYCTYPSGGEVRAERSRWC